MKFVSILSLCVVLSVSSVKGQTSLDPVLSEIEKNNTSLQAALRHQQASVLLNKTGITPEDPIVGMNYLWGNPVENGNRQDFSFMQSVDFPTAYVYRRDIADVKNKQTELQFQQQRKQLRLQARLLLIDLIYHNRMCAEAAERKKQSEELLNAVRKNYEAGSCSILDYHKAELSAMMFSDALQEWESGRLALLTELEGLNGGKYLVFSERDYPVQSLPADFEEWYLVSDKSNPELAILEKQAVIGSLEEKLNKSLLFPGLSAGYMREQVVGQTFQGLSVGVSIPLWANRNKLSYARANLRLMQDVQQDAKLQYFTRLKRLYGMAVTLQDRLQVLKEKTASFTNHPLLAKAYGAGEISLMEFLLELTLFYEYTDKILSTEKELQKTIATLNQYQ